MPDIERILREQETIHTQKRQLGPPNVKFLALVVVVGVVGYWMMAPGLNNSNEIIEPIPTAEIETAIITMNSSTTNETHQNLETEKDIYSDSNECSSCHSSPISSELKHVTLDCVYCHEEHSYIPKCIECHGSMHGLSFRCNKCHMTAHNLVVPT